MRMFKVKNLWLFSPARNVGRFIERGLEIFEDLQLILAARGCQLHLLVIDDKSEDDTFEKLSAFAEKHNFLDVQRNKRNLGNAANIITGYEWALLNADSGTDLIGCLDADGEHNPLSFRRHIDYIAEEGFDGVVGSIIYPDDRMGWMDLNMMRFMGGMQAATMGVDNPFYVQSPGWQLHKVQYIREAVYKLYPQYHAFFAKTNPQEEFPRWGMHGVIDGLATLAGSKLKSAYLECFGVPPNRDVEKLRLQGWAAMIHLKTLEAFGRYLLSGKTGTTSVVG